MLKSGKRTAMALGKETTIMPLRKLASGFLNFRDGTFLPKREIFQALAQKQEEESGGGVLAWFGFAPEERPVTKPEDFGVTNLPDNRPGAPVAITEISANVLEHAKNAFGRSLFILDNGQVWKQIDGDTTELHHRSSDGQMKVRIEKAFMGSFSLSVDGRNTKIKVRRIK
jgi:hypothetical protein